MGRARQHFSSPAAVLAGAFCLFGLASASSNPVMRRQAAATTTAATTTKTSYKSLTSCHVSNTIQYCMDGSTEWRVVADATATASLPSSYTDCHNHGTATYCMNPSGGEVQIIGALATLTSATASASASAASHSGTITTTSTSITAITDCHLHSSSIFCMVGSDEYYVSTTVTATQDVPAQYTGCHGHGTELWCMTEDSEVQAIAANALSTATSTATATSEPQGENCHFHAGVEHCVSSGESESSSSTTTCERRDRDYKIPIRVGMLFVVLVASSIGVFGPILISNFYQVKSNIVLTVLKQFGTGVIISTAFVHLYTHASMMFNNDCMYTLVYEGVTSAIVMAGLFISFLIEFVVSRAMRWQAKKKSESESETDVSPQAVASAEMANISIMEAGIIFHSLLIGITLVVAGDSFFVTLAIVIIFHQLFEGIALGSRIAALGYGTTFSHVQQVHMHAHDAPAPVVDRTGPSAVPLSKKLFLAAGFAIVTPIGMAIGIGVLQKFNGNDPATLVAIGTLDAFSAGILVWVGLVEMWAHDWMLGGELTDANALTTSLAMFGLITGMVLMSLLGKWA